MRLSLIVRNGPRAFGAEVRLNARSLYRSLGALESYAALISPGRRRCLKFFSAAVLAWTLLGNRERVLLAGTFHSVAHRGTREAQIVALSDGRRVLRLLDVKSYPAPELEVCLAGAPDAEDNDTVRASRVHLSGNPQAKGWVRRVLPATADRPRA